MLDKMRKLTESCKRQKTLLTEEGGVQIPEKAIAITDDPKFGEKVLSKQKEHFRSAVESGVEFSRPDDNNPSESPLIYMPETGNIVFSGTIPSLDGSSYLRTIQETVVSYGVMSLFLIKIILERFLNFMVIMKIGKVNGRIRLKNLNN